MDDDVDTLPPPSDAYWDDLTADTLTFLRDLRSEHRRRRLGSAAYVGYVIALFGGVYGAPYAVSAVTAAVPAAASSQGTAAVVACAAAAVLLAVLTALTRDGAWRGPALLDPASTVWVLSSPVRIGPLLRPRLRVSLLAAAAVGAVAGAGGGLEANVLAGGSAAWLAPAGAFAVGVVAVLGTAIAALVEEGGVPGARAAGSPRGAWLWLATGVLAAVGVWAVGVWPGGGANLAAQAVLWSGPWGWAAQPLVAATPSGARLAPLWPLGSALALATAAVVVRIADRRIEGVSARVLRRRAQTVADVSGALFTLQPRRARLLVQAAQGAKPRRTVRLPMPRRRLLLVPWRDLTGLLRMPSRLLWAVLWLAVALWLTGVRDGVLLTLGAFVAAYLSAAQLVEPARVDADDVRRLRITPAAATHIALQHAATPIAVLLGCCLAWAAVEAGLGGQVTVSRVALAVPAVVGAALVSAFRGHPPMGVFGGGASPMGDAGPVLILLWYLRGPLVAFVLLAPIAFGAGESPTWGAAAAVILLQWATRRAEAVLRA